LGKRTVSWSSSLMDVTGKLRAEDEEEEEKEKEGRGMVGERPMQM
jgi:hypothetical protein